ncbi:ClpP/crotonase-like domain-containing protein, partial [Colletotrichum cereale]
VTLNSPSDRNSLSVALITALGSVLRELDSDPTETVAIVITGYAPGQSFSSGFNVAEMAALPAHDIQKALDEFVTSIDNLSTPTIAAVAGTAFGGGCELALACDIIYCTKDTRFALPEVKLGLLAAGGGLRRLSRWVGTGRAAILALTGCEWTGQDAEKWGMVKECLPSWCDCSAIYCAQMIAANSIPAVRATKRLLKASADAGSKEILELEKQIFRDLLNSEEHFARRDAWLNRKKLSKCQGI